MINGHTLTIRSLDRAPLQIAGESAADYAGRLSDLGYRRVSNKYNRLSRIDRADWKQEMARNHVRGIAWVNMLSEGNAADFYRRTHSKDVIEVPHDIAQLVPTSGWDATGYIVLGTG